MRWVPGAHGLDRLLEFLGQQGVLAVSVPTAGPVEELVGRYRRWLVGDRGLAEATVERYVKLARLFLTQRSTGSVLCVENLTGTDIVAFLLRESDRLSVGSVKGRVAELRSLLTFLYLQGLTSRPLTTVVPPVAGWRDTGVPKAIPAADVQLLLGSCDGIVKLLTLCGAARIGRCGDCGEVQGLPVSDRGHRARGVAVSPFRAESAGRRGADAGPRRGGHLRDDPVLVCQVRAGLRRPVTSSATPPRRQMAPRRGLREDQGHHPITCGVRSTSTATCSTSWCSRGETPKQPSGFSASCSRACAMRRG